MLIVFVAAPAGPATARAAATTVSARMSFFMRGPCPPALNPMRDAPSVLLTTTMSLQTAHRRALVAGGTGRVGRAIAGRLRAGGWQGVGGRGAGRGPPT